jgi:hypothetical protein
MLAAARHRDTEQQQEKSMRTFRTNIRRLTGSAKPTEIVRRLTTVTSAGLILGWIATTGASAVTAPVAGIQSPPQTTAGHPGDPCGIVDPQTRLAPILKNTMTGSLIGCWYTDTLNEIQTKPNGDILAIGTEHFVGCLDRNRDRSCTHREPHGTLALIYAFEGSFDHAGRELSGQCQHPILSGTGGFQGAHGQINFSDNVTDGTSDYQGQITLANHTSAARVTATASRAARPIC